MDYVEIGPWKGILGEPSQGGRDAKEGTQRGEDRLRVEAGRERGKNPGYLPEAGDLGSDLLPVEAPV